MSQEQSKHPRCPRCQSTGTSRMRRQGFLMRHLAPYLGLFPWECGSCRKVFVSRERGNMVKMGGTMRITALRKRGAHRQSGQA